MSRIRSALADRRHREGIYSTAAYWNAKAAGGTAGTASMWPNAHLNYYYHRETVEVLGGHFPNVAGLRILDAGCGTGRIARHLASCGARVDGIDFSSGALEAARRQSSGENPEYRLLSLFDLRDENAYDLVVSWGSVTFAARNRAELLIVLSRLRRAIHEGGRALLLEPVHQGILHRVLNLNLAEFCEVMQEAGFRVDRVTHMHFWPARILLAYWPCPRILTAIGYHLGQVFLRAMGKRRLGDYKAILATADHGSVVTE